MNELTKMFHDENVGVSMFDVKIDCLFWADDVVLIANNETDLQKMLNIASNFSERWNLISITPNLMLLLLVNVKMKTKFGTWVIVVLKKSTTISTLGFIFQELFRTMFMQTK